MCQSCPFDPVAHVEEVLARNRFTMIHVHASRTAPELGYTVGLTRQGLPELVISGLRADVRQCLLATWGDYLIDESQVLAGERLTCGPWHLEAVQVERPENHLALAHGLYGGRLRALQLAWADADGRWPWEPRPRRVLQVVLGSRSPWFCDQHRPDRLDVPDAP